MMDIYNINNNQILLTSNTKKDTIIKILVSEKLDTAVIYEEIIPYKKYKIYILEKDGSYSNMCGNGCIAMCLKFKNNLILYNSLEEQVITQYDKDYIKIKLNVISKKQNDLYVCGEPHKVYFVSEYKRDQHESAGLANIPGFNTTYVFIKNNNYYYSTFERGVNNITGACGTGAFAVISYLHNNIGPVTKTSKLYTI